MMPSFDQHKGANLSSLVIDQLQSGELVDAKGWHDTLWHEVISEVQDGPFAADLFAAMGRSPSDEASRYTDSFFQALTDTAAAQEIAAVICSGEVGDQEFRRAVFGALPPVFGDRQRESGVRAAALKGALFIAQSSRRHFRLLQAALLDIDPQDDPEFLRSAAAIVGIVVAHEHDDELIKVLRDLSSVPRAADEAMFSLGNIRLADALGTSDGSKARDAFGAARDCFLSAAKVEGRDDAVLYAAATTVLLDFSAGASPADLQDQLPALRSALFDYLAVNLTRDERAPDQSWLGLRMLAATHWAAISVALSALASSLERSVWLNGVRVLEEELFFILTANHTLFERDSEGGIKALVSPRIVTSFLEHKAQLDILNQWLDQQDTSSWQNTAIALQADIQAQLTRSISRLPFPATDASPAAVALYSHKGIPTEAAADAAMLIEAARKKFSLSQTDPIAETILVGMVHKLFMNADFQRYPAARDVFINILRVTLKFVISRDAAQKGPGSEYLFEWEATAPLEKALQADYLYAIRLSDLSRLSVKEPQDVSAGRADVQFVFDGFTLVSECKRTFDNLTNVEAAVKFGAQVVSYQISNVTFSALLILDLFDRAGSSRHITERASVEIVSPHGTKDYAIAIFQVPGRRQTPSALSLAKIQAKSLGNLIQ